MSRLLLITDPGLMGALRLKLQEPKPRPEAKFPGVLLNDRYGVRVIESRYLIKMNDGPPPATILGDFDRWFREAISRIEWRKVCEEERRQRQLDSAWRL